MNFFEAAKHLGQGKHAHHHHDEADAVLKLGNAGGETLLPALQVNADGGDHQAQDRGQQAFGRGFS